MKSAVLAIALSAPAVGQSLEQLMPCNALQQTMLPNQHLPLYIDLQQRSKEIPCFVTYEKEKREVHYIPGQAGKPPVYADVFFKTERKIFGKKGYIFGRLEIVPAIYKKIAFGINWKF